ALVGKRDDVEALAVGARIALARGDATAARERVDAALGLVPKGTVVDPELSTVQKLVLLAPKKTRETKKANNPQQRNDEAKRSLRAARDSFAEHGPPEARYFLSLAKARRLAKENQDLPGALEAG